MAKKKTAPEKVEVKKEKPLTNAITEARKRKKAFVK